MFDFISNVLRNLRGRERFDMRSDHRGEWLLRDDPKELQERSAEFNDTGNRLFREISRSFLIGFGAILAYSGNYLVTLEDREFILLTSYIVILSFTGVTAALANLYFIARHFTAIGTLLYTAAQLINSNENSEDQIELTGIFEREKITMNNFRNLYRFLTIIMFLIMIFIFIIGLLFIYVKIF